MTSDNNNIPKYEPTEEEKVILKEIKDAYSQGETNQNKKIQAFSNQTAEEVYEAAQNAFNMVHEEVEQSLMDNWKADTKRPVVKTKIIAIISSFIKQLMIPSVKAMEDSVPKQQRAEVARLLLDDWRNRVKYDTKMRSILLDAASSPMTVAKVGYSKMYKNKRYWNKETEEFDTKQVIDDILTGFYFNKMKFGQVLVSNIEERDVQKQSWMIERPVLYKETLQSEYGKADNWKYVREGEYFNIATEEYKNDDNIDGGQVEKVVFMSRTRDIYWVTLNGVLVENTTLTKKRVFGDYPYIRLGAEPLTNENSWYSYPLILRLKEDQKLREKLWNLVIDSEYLDTFRPKVGTQQLSAEAYVPGAYTKVREKFELTDLHQGGSKNLLNVITQLDQDTEEVSPAHASGVPIKGERSRREWVDLSNNAFTSQGVFLAEIKDFVEEVTRGALNDILQNQTLDALNKISSGKTPASVIIRNGFKGDQSMDVELRYTNPLAGEVTDPLTRSFNIEKEEKQKGVKIIEINPNALLSTSFDIYIEPEQLTGQNDDAKRMLAREAYLTFSQNPTVKLDKITKDLAKHYYKGDVNEFVKSEQEIKAEQQQAQAAQQMEVGRVGGEDNSPTPVEGNIPTQ